MLKKITKLFCCIILLIISIIGLNSCNNANNLKESFVINDKTVDSIVQLALDDTEIRLKDYVDIEYFSNLEESSKTLINSIKAVSFSSKKEDTVNIDDEQYTALTKSITNIFDDLNAEEYNVFKELAEQDSDINNMLEMIENRFESNSYESLSSADKKNHIVKLSAGVMTIASILSRQNFCKAAIVAIKGAFNSMLATLKAFFIPNTVKGVIVTASIFSNSDGSGC